MTLTYFKICQSKIFSVETAQTCILVWALSVKPGVNAFTLSANSYRFCLQLDFLLFILLIANSGNYLHLSIVVHYKTVCSNNLLSVNYNFNSNY